MKVQTKIIIFFFATLTLILQSCEKKSEKTGKKTTSTIRPKESSISTNFKSKLRPDENLVLEEIYTDTVQFINFDDNADDWYFNVLKNNDTIGLIYNNDDPQMTRGDLIRIQWKMDSLRPAGDPEYLDYSEYLIQAKKIKEYLPKENNFSKVKNQSFVISCGSGCAMTYEVKKIRQISQPSIEVIFEVKMYIDEKLTETFDETYTFNYGNINSIQRVVPNGKNENINEVLPENAVMHFREFGAQLIR